MKFTEKLADEIAAKHNVPAATIRTWRRRGAIPDKYRDRPTLERADKKTTEYLRAVLGSDHINAAGLGAVSSQQKDAAAGRSAFYMDDADRLVLAAKNLRADLRRWIKSESGLRKILADNRLRNYVRDDNIQRFVWRQYKHTTEVELRDEEAEAIRQITNELIRLLSRA